MKVFVEDAELVVAPGMTVRHALKMAGALHRVLSGERTVCDAWGNGVGLDGELTEGVRLSLKTQSPVARPEGKEGCCE